VAANKKNDVTCFVFTAVFTFVYVNFPECPAIPELLSSTQAKDQESIRKIRQSLEETKLYLGSRAEADWSQFFYQYTNRLAHLYLLKKNKLPAYLINVYFLNDAEMNGPTSLYEWKGAIRLLNSYLGIRRHKLQKFMIDLYIDINKLG
jgi:hypothetical protein